ncbi:MAG TPA: hypothetical protein VNA12_06605 [Mycobacteriales bacterium]|nr:hypothetical protein [Mycobacteriales bacterium]
MITTNEHAAERVRELRLQAALAGRTRHHPLRAAVRRVRSSVGR